MKNSFYSKPQVYVAKAEVELLSVSDIGPQSDSVQPPGFEYKTSVWDEEEESETHY